MGFCEVWGSNVLEEASFASIPACHDTFELPAVAVREGLSPRHNKSLARFPLAQVEMCSQLAELFGFRAFLCALVCDLGPGAISNCMVCRVYRSRIPDLDLQVLGIGAGTGVSGAVRQHTHLAGDATLFYILTDTILMHQSTRRVAAHVEEDVRIGAPLGANSKDRV